MTLAEACLLLVEQIHATSAAKRGEATARRDAEASRRLLLAVLERHIDALREFSEARPGPGDPL